MSVFVINMFTCYICEFLLISGPVNRTKIEGWDFTFAMDWQVIPQSANTQCAGRYTLQPGNIIQVRFYSYSRQNGIRGRIHCGKRRSADYLQFLLSHYCYQKALSSGCVQYKIVWERVNPFTSYRIFMSPTS